MRGLDKVIISGRQRSSVFVHITGKRIRIVPRLRHLRGDCNFILICVHVCVSASILTRARVTHLAVILLRGLRAWCANRLFTSCVFRATWTSGEMITVVPCRRNRFTIYSAISRRYTTFIGRWCSLRFVVFFFGRARVPTLVTIWKICIKRYRCSAHINEFRVSDRLRSLMGTCWRVFFPATILIT